MALGIVEPTWQRGSAEARQPYTYPEVVERFREFLREVATEVHVGGGRVFIGIDELDKIGSGDQAQRFVNELKAVFRVPHVYYLVSVSDDAQAAFKMRGLPIRDAFDSAFDRIFTVPFLPLADSRRFIRKRVIGMSEPYIHLCHCLSGGLPRDLIRICRRFIGSGGEGPMMSEICGEVLAEDVAGTTRCRCSWPTSTTPSPCWTSSAALMWRR